jgi:RNA polymerase sigma-70 factor (ECF subfamily)
MTGPPAPSSFAPTRWTLVLRAKGTSEESQKALGELCECYWTPVFRFLRSQGQRDEEARELTQEFFARLLKRANLEAADPERGRFRSYLLGALKNFLHDSRDYQHRLKRGGGAPVLPLGNPDETGACPAFQVPDPATPPPDAVFDRAWAMAVMDRALAGLEGEMAASGKARQFLVLKPWLQGDYPALSQVAAAELLNLNEGAVKVAIHRLRKRFRELVRAELAQTVRAPDDVEGELRYLVEVLARA